MTEAQPGSAPAAAPAPASAPVQEGEIGTPAKPWPRLDAGITGWRRVSPKYLGVEFAGLAVGTLVMLAVGAAVLMFNQTVGWIVLGLVAVTTVLRAVLLPRRVASIGFVLRADDLVFRRGVLFARVVAVPYGRMQLVDINRGPVARALGLAELRLVTAAAGSDVTIPGLAEQDAADLRDRLIERAEERRVGL